MRKKLFLIALIVGITALVVATIPAKPLDKIPVCHKFGTPAQKTLYLPYPAAMAHVRAHGDFACACPSNDFWVDADGTASPGDGLVGAIDPGFCGANLTSWPTGFWVEGLDWFDNDGSCTWTPGDDLHVEGSVHPTALRNAVHDSNAPFFDPVVLDWDGSFFDGQPVDVDLETGSAFTGCPGVDPLLKFFDANGNGFWDDGEDIILDRNNDGVFN